MPAEDSLFEKALARQLRERTAGGTPAADEGSRAREAGDVEHEDCPEAEILGAYHERLLSGEEMNLWKGHIFSCARCQEILSQLEKTEDILVTAEDENHVAASPGNVIPAPAVIAMQSRAAQELIPLKESVGTAMPRGRGPEAGPAEKPRRPFHYWIVAAGAAAVLLVWVGMYERAKNDSHEVAVQTAQNRVASAPVEEGRARISDQNKVASAPTLDDKASLGSREPDAIVRKKSYAKTPSPMKPAGTAASAGSAFDKPAEALAGNSASKTEAAAGEAFKGKRDDNAHAYAGSVSSRAATPNVEVLSAAGPVAQDQASGANVPPPPSGQELQTSQVQAVPVPAPAPAAAAKSAAAKDRQLSDAQAASALMNLQSEAVTVSKGANLHAVAQTQNPRMIPAPGGNVIWRVGKGGLIEQSANAGGVWTRQNSGVGITLESGSAPSEAVCWVFGRPGTIVLTVDGGGHWTKIDSPIAGDIGGLLAVDALHATIWDVAKKNNFVTADGGVTWTRVANP